MKTAKFVTLSRNGTYDKKTPQEERVHALIKEKTGADLEVVYTTMDQYDSKLNLMIAGNEPLDYATVKMSAAIELYKAGAIIPVNELLDQYGPNLKKNVSEFAWQEATYQGQILGIATENTFPTGNVVQIRTDWLEKLNLPVPETIEEFEAAMDAFVNGDPDGNGVKDTWGLSPRNIPMFRLIYAFAPFFMPQANQWWLDEATGKLMPPELAPEFKTMMGKFIEWREKGWLWPETMTASFEEQDELIARNKTGTVYGWGTWAITGWEQLVKSGVTEANFAPLALKGPGINQLPTLPYLDNVIVITAKNKNPDVLMRFFDFAATPEGLYLTTYGIEGDNYTVNPDGTIKYISEDPDDINKANYYSKYNVYTLAIDEVDLWRADSFVHRKYNEARRAFAALPKFNAIDKFVPYDQSAWQSASKLNDMQTFLDEHYLKVFNGEIPLSDWDSVMEQWLDIGGELLIEDKTKQFSEYMSANN